MKHAMLGSLLVFMLSGCATGRDVCEDTDQDSPKINLELSLVDGSRIIGVPKIETVPLETSYAKISIPLAKIQSITMNKDHETASLELRDGDKLKGVVSLDPIKLETVFGSVKIDMKHIQKMEILLCGRAGQNGLVLWNRLDSENDILKSRVGPGGKLNAGRFVEGRFGKGVELNMKEQYGVTFPPETVQANAGSIEFWAKLVKFPTSITEGYHPSMICSDTPEGGGFHLFIAPNNGAAGGGLCINSRFGWVATGPFGSWSYAAALKSPKTDDWHHYALVWSGVGNMLNVADPTRKICVFVDGQLNTAFGNSSRDERQLFASGNGTRFGFIGYPSDAIPGASIVFDNLKVWNYAKTDFSDRNNE